MKILVMDRNNAIKYCTKPHIEESVIVSIFNPCEDYSYTPYKSFQNKVKDILKIGFYDIEEDYPTNNGKMSISDANKIKHFIEKNKDKTIIVHCDYGCSRSAGIAAALSKYYNDDDESYFNNSYYQPNMLCYNLMLNTLENKSV